jgi:acetolactate synthase-1/2/3 large subunit
MDALNASKIRYVSTRHEQVAVCMADAEGRVTGKPGVAFVHGGPGFLNSLVSLSNAYKDSSPVLPVAGAVKRRNVGLDSWLEVPQSEMAKSVVKASFRIGRGSDASKAVAEAYSIAASDPKGPVLVEVPEDVWTLDAGQKGSRATSSTAPLPTNEEVEGVRDALALARKPLIVVGGGMNSARGAAALRSLLSRAEIPVATSGNGRGAIAEDDELCLGRIGFGGGNRGADAALQDADVGLCIGGGLSDVSTYGFNLKPREDVLVVDLDPLWDKKPLLYTSHFRCDAPSFAEALARVAKEGRLEGTWKEAIEKGRRDWTTLLREQLSRRKKGFVNPGLFLSSLDAAMPKDAIIGAGQGLHVLYAYAFMKVRSPASFLAATNMGSMGFVFPAILGAKLSFPQREVVGVMGDGEFMMTVQDMETAVRERIGVKIVVVNDSSYRVLLMRQKLQKMGRVFGTVHTNPDVVKLAESFGAQAQSIHSEERIGDAVAFLAARSDLPRIVELKVDQEDLPPLNLEGSLMF